MNSLFCILLGIVIGLLVIVVYQGRKEPFNISLVLNRVIKLSMKLFNLIKEIGLFTAVKFRETDWNVSNDKITNDKITNDKMTNDKMTNDKS